MYFFTSFFILNLAKNHLRRRIANEPKLREKLLAIDTNLGIFKNYYFFRVFDNIDMCRNFNLDMKLHR